MPKNFNLQKKKEKDDSGLKSFSPTHHNMTKEQTAKEEKRAGDNYNNEGKSLRGASAVF